jgi:hypothetical protein
MVQIGFILLGLGIGYIVMKAALALIAWAEKKEKED